MGKARNICSNTWSSAITATGPRKPVRKGVSEAALERIHFYVDLELKEQGVWNNLFNFTITISSLLRDYKSEGHVFL